MANTFRLNTVPAWMTEEKTVSVLKALENKGVDSPRFIGGSVRDSIINKPVYDVDIATPLLPEQTMKYLKKAGIKTVPTGLKHGTVTAIVDKTPFEITTLRKDIETDGRHAKVEFTDSWEEDAARRDFTINAMSSDAEGNIFDYFGGLKDLHSGVIRFIGSAEERISEDFLRILRFFRFYAYYGRGEADAESLSFCEKFADKISNLSKERITYEFLRMLSADKAADACSYMASSNVMQKIIPEFDIEKLSNIIALEKDFDASQDNIDYIRRLSALTKKLPELFRMSNEQKKQFNLLQEIEDINPDASKEFLRLKIYEYGHGIMRDKALLSASSDLGNKEEYKKHHQFITACRLPKLQVIGKDVLSMGISEGKYVGEALKEVETWWMQRDFVPGRSECLTYLQGVVRKLKER